VYVQTDGQVGFTQAHSAYIPPGAVTVTFSHTTGASFGTFGFTGLGATGFVACPTTTSGFPYQIYANVKGHDFSKCLGFNAVTGDFNGGFAAWQYT
jgi:hypothetical protein